jgi:hypothetical protein
MVDFLRTVCAAPLPIFSLPPVRTSSNEKVQTIIEQQIDYTRPKHCLGNRLKEKVREPTSTRIIQGATYMLHPVTHQAHEGYYCWSRRFPKKFCCGAEVYVRHN